ncbi:MAG: hypothetical protein Q4F81_06385 [Eubacteriales bacterium]|nr:hypothetical protein [Eubacteriales bacterium]
MTNEQIPPRFRELGLPAVHTSDGFWMSRKSIADILLEKSIRTFPSDRGQERECGLFFDDWHLYAIEDEGWVYSLVKLREQEHDREEGRVGDGDTPGVTVSFIAFQPEILTQCLASPAFENRQALNREINRVVSFRGQHHHPALKWYFEKTESVGAYLIAEEYVRKIASLAENGRVPTPDSYKKAKKGSRLPAFIEENNARAGYTVCDHEFIFIRDREHPNAFETLAILATYTADVSFPSFAAEVQYHACFLTAPARIPVPFLGHSIYDSAIRADMTIDDCELEGPAPFHNLNSHWVRRQAQCHPEYGNP